MSTLSIQKTHLADLLYEKANARSDLMNLKNVRAKYRRDIDMASLQGGLLSKPALMHDYDETTELIDKTNKDVMQKRMQLDTLLNKIKITEQLLSEFHV